MAITEDIAGDLKKFDSVLMIVDGDGDAEGLSQIFCKSKALEKTSKKVLILSAADIALAGHDGCEYRRINDEDQSAILQLYAMYDFSNRFQVLSDNSQYGGLLNYVKTGLMTIEEVFRAILA